MFLNLNKKKLLAFFTSIFCFILIVDPPNVIFRIKDFVYIAIIFLCMSLYNAVSVRRICVFLLVYALLVATLMRGVYAGYEYDYDFTILMFKSFAPLLLLLWIDKIELLSKVTFPSVCIGIICILITFTMFWFEDIEVLIYDFLSDNNNFIMMSRREFLGMTFTGVFYRSLPLVIIPCSVYSYKYWFEKQNNKKNLAISLILFAALFFSGTRASMLSALLIFIGTAITKLYKVKGGMLILYLLFVLGTMFFGMLLFSLLAETDESSNEIKYGHLKSYMELFDRNLDILFWGQGVGGMFYTEGFGVSTMLTEWSFIELIRYFGIFGAIYIIMIYLYPVSVIWKNRLRLKYAYSIIGGYILYLLIAGTNPLLVNSTGMLALLVVYSYAYNPLCQNSLER
ncbi:hypothetical protein DW121_00705 [Bacteroides sp. AM10-21B]|nr:hypothetical protein DW121_00705 [Bacteroides sp. AM10-21B]